LVQTSQIGYFRFHGVPKLFYSEYTRDELEQLHEAIRLTDWKDVYVYFNNTASKGGILNALEMMTMDSE
jgi:uncharacterized protein YecE (DUF72 family)